MASDEITSTSDQHIGVSTEGERSWRDQYSSESSYGFRPAVVLLACDYPNKMQSDLTLALHLMAEVPIINHNMDAALALEPSQVVVTAADAHIKAVQQVVEKAYPHTSCPVSIVKVDTVGTDRHDITRNQRQKALEALAHNITEVIEWPCHWLITHDIAQKLVTIGRERLHKQGTGCYSVCVGARSRHVNFTKEEGPHPLWATAGYWRKALQGPSRYDSNHRYGVYDAILGKQPAIIADRWDLSEAEQCLRCSERKRHLEAGVTFRDTEFGNYLSAGLEIGRDTVIGVGVQIYGKTVIGRNVRIEGPTVIKDSVIGDDCRIGAFSHLEQARLASGSGVGPFARLRAGAALDSGAYIGNFVELKGAHVGQGGNVCHLSYLGDADVGARANIGAGTITCNYNGVAKNRTSIAADAFIGSNSTLVAPVTVGQGALVAAGSVITSDVPSDALALGRSRQTILEHRASATRKKLRTLEQQKSQC